MLRSLILFVLIGSAVARMFYRKDYQYFHEFEAFYKFHWSTPASSWLEAFTTCASEGATLFYLSVPEEFNVVKNLTAAAPRSSYPDIFVGIHDEFDIGELITVDGSSTPFPIFTNDLVANSLRSCVMLDIETGRYHIEDCGFEVNLNITDVLVDKKRAFICKKTPKRSLCPTVDDEYKYNEVTKKCYKVSRQIKTWNGAFRQCYMEGAMMFVPENSEEYDEVVRRYIRDDEESNRYRKSTNGINNDVSNSYFVGIYQPQEHGEYFTAKGFHEKKIQPNDDDDDEGVPMVTGGVYQRFYPSDDQQIQGSERNGKTACVTLVRKDRSYNNDIYHWYMFDDCDSPRQFICEMKSTVLT